MRAWLACRRCCRLCIAIRRAASIEMGPMQKHEVAEHEVADAEESKEESTEESKGAFPNPHVPPSSTEPDMPVPSSQPLCSSSSRLRMAYDRVKRTLCTSSASSPPVIDQPDSCEEKDTRIFIDNPLNRIPGNHSPGMNFTRAQLCPLVAACQITRYRHPILGQFHQ